MKSIAEELDALARLAVAYSLRELSGEEYQGARRKLLERLRRLEAQMVSQTTAITNEALLEALGAIWEDLGRIAEHPAILTSLPVESRRELFQTLIAKVVVRRKDLKPRVQVAFRW